MKKQQMDLRLFFTAKNAVDALGIADTIAGTIEEDYETPSGGKVEVQVCPLIMEETTRKSIMQILKYLWKDERTHYESAESAERANHIFNDISRVREWMKRVKT